MHIKKTTVINMVISHSISIVLFILNGYLCLCSSENKQVGEVEALAKLEHKNIVRYYHSWKEQAPADWKTNHLWEPLKDSQSG